jgi:hypothetical protein
MVPSSLEALRGNAKVQVNGKTNIATHSKVTFVICSILESEVIQICMAISQNVVIK